MKATVTAANIFEGWETFYVRMDQSGRITILKLTLRPLQDRTREKQSLTGAVMEVRLEPVIITPVTDAHSVVRRLFFCA